MRQLVLARPARVSFPSTVIPFIDLTIVRNPTVAEDLTQETFLRVFRKLETLRADISTNLCRDHYRQSTRSPKTVAIAASRDDASTAVQGTLADTGRPLLDQWLEQHEMSACVQKYIDDPDRAGDEETVPPVLFGGNGDIDGALRRLARVQYEAVSEWHGGRLSELRIACYS